MSLNEIPSLVPLPKVPQYTEDITFGNLELPQGFDEERLLVNLPAFQRVRRVAGLGSISIRVVDGEALDYFPIVQGLDASGAATMGSAAPKPHRSMATGNVRFPTPATQYDSPDVTVNIDNAAYKKKLEENSRKNGVVILRDPVPRARSLNSAVCSGLADASKHANFDVSKVKSSAFFYGWMTSLGLVEGMDIRQAAIHTAITSPIGPVIANLTVAWNTLYSGMTVREALSSYRQSYFVGCAPDRYLASMAIIASTKFIKAAT